ncbi:MAG TPA: protein kinase [Propionicimonas sp.]|nr:protein kinase [Propionicimonas sp.]
MTKSDIPPDIVGLSFIRKLGRGGYADVFLYDQATPQRKVAVKVLRETGLSAATIDRFTAEANAMARLEHPYIVPVYTTGTTVDHRPYLAMMYYPRPSLAERARAERFSVAETLKLGIQLGAAVETAHRAGLLHRDIKPANVLTDAYGRPGLTDFGIAGQLAAGDEDDVGVSVPWSPPETLYATAPASVRSDVYSLAATLWHLLVGRSPFEVPGGENTPFALMRRIRDVPAPSTGRADVPASLDRLLRAAMGKDAAVRPSSAFEFVGALQAIEQEMRLPRTPLELASAEHHSNQARAYDGGDRTQVRAPQRISPDSALPPVIPASSAASEADPAAQETRRSHRPVAPIAAYDEHVIGETVLRGAPDSSEVPAVPPAPRTRSILVVAVGLAVVGVLVGIGWVVVTQPQPQRPDPTASVTAPPPDVDQPMPPPGTPMVKCTRKSTLVRCSWTYSNALPDDQFEWRPAGSNQRIPTKKASVSFTSHSPACIEVRVIRKDGSYVANDWTKGCSK